MKSSWYGQFDKPFAKDKQVYLWPSVAENCGHDFFCILPNHTNAVFNNVDFLGK